MLLVGGVIGPSTGMLIGGLTAAMADIGVDALTEVCMAVLVVVEITLGGVAPVLYDTDVSARTVSDTDCSIGMRSDLVIMLLIGGVIGPSTRMLIGGLTAAMAGISV